VLLPGKTRWDVYDKNGREEIPVAKQRLEAWAQLAVNTLLLFLGRCDEILVLKLM
jgi:hypothetical protein